MTNRAITQRRHRFRRPQLAVTTFLCAFLVMAVCAFLPGHWAGRSAAQTSQDSMTGTVKPSSESCEKCHQNVTEPHQTKVDLTCVECHGGNGKAPTKEGAHIKPLHPEKWRSSANPQESFTLLNNESQAWIRFVNPRTCVPPTWPVASVTRTLTATSSATLRKAP